MASVRLAHRSRDEVVERLEQLSCERGMHASRKEEHLARTRGESGEVRDERQSERTRRLE